MFKLKRKMYGLFFNIYDYQFSKLKYLKWYNLIAVSRSKRNLVERAEYHIADHLAGVLEGIYPAISLDETRHYVIEEIEAI